MGGYGSYYKGEKKKKKKGVQSSDVGFVPTFVPPQIIVRSKKEN